MRNAPGLCLTFYTLFIFLLSGCCKDPVTPAPPVIPAKVQLLIGKTWQAQEVNSNTNCIVSHYARGAAGNTGINYDPVRFTFAADSTGTHTDPTGSTYPIVWYFNAGDSSRMQIIVLASTPVVYQWNLVEIWGNKFIQSMAVTGGGNQILTSSTFVPTTTVTVTPPALTRTQMLTQKQWMIQEVYDHSGCTIKHYLLNGSGNTGSNYAIWRYKFNADGTGTHTDVNGGNYTLTWQWTSADERNLKVTVNGTAVYNWTQIELLPGTMYVTSIIGNNVLDATKLITIP